MFFPVEASSAVRAVSLALVSAALAVGRAFIRIVGNHNIAGTRGIPDCSHRAAGELTDPVCPGAEQVTRL